MIDPIRVALTSGYPSGVAEPLTLAAPSRATDRPVTSVICPYLLAADGSWRASTPARDHRCTAVVPPAPLAFEKQRRLCLVADHRSCATFQAATGEGDLGAISAMPMIRATTRSTRAMARTTPVILDHGRFVVGVPALRSGGGIGQGLVIALMAIAFAFLVFARLSSSGGGSPDQGLAGASHRSQAPSATPTRRPAASPTAAQATAAPTPQPTPKPTSGAHSPTPVPSASSTPAIVPATYRVRSGDTLSGIAARYGTTVSALMKRNGITDPSRLRVGQVLHLR
jgi:LysM repeat protein